MLKLADFISEKCYQVIPGSSCVLPAQNLPIAKPTLLIEGAKEFNAITLGKKKGTPGENNTLIFLCNIFSCQIGRRFMPQLGK